MRSPYPRFKVPLRRGMLITTGVFALLLFELLLCEASAQELHVHAGKQWVDHPLMGAPTGLGIGLGMPVANRVGLRLGYERLRDGFGSFGSTCVGLVSPEEDCEPEAGTDRARVSAFRFVGVVSLIAGDRVTVALLPGVRTGSLSSIQRGRRTGRSRSARKRVYGLDIGGELRVKLHPGRALFVHLRGSAGSLRPWTEEHIADGYTPFEAPARFTQLELGLSMGR